MFFEQGLSGLNAAAQTLNVIGKNIANGSTTGYKTASINFTNVMSNALNTANSGVSLQTGAGPQSSNIQQLFTQGTITSTNNPLDVAINGKGFFQLQDPTTQQLSYTRDGQFRMDAQYGIVNAMGQQLTGFGPNIIGGTATPLNLTNSQTMKGSQTKAVTAQVSLIGTEKGTTNPFNPADQATYNYSTSMSIADSNGKSQNLQLYFVQSSNVPDSSIGIPAPIWSVYATTDAAASNVISLGQVNIDSSGAIKSVSPFAINQTATSVTSNINSHITSINSAYTDEAKPGVIESFSALSAGQTLTVNNLTFTAGDAGTTAAQTAAAFANIQEGNQVTQTFTYGSFNTTVPNFSTGDQLTDPAQVIFNSGIANTALAFSCTGNPPTSTIFSSIKVNGNADNVISVNLAGLSVGLASSSTMSMDGYTQGSLSSFNIGPDGKIIGSYSNGQTQNLGSVALASFASDAGLQALGSNAWIATAAAGKLTIGIPGDQQLGLGALQSSALESSNEDQTADMVGLLAAQRAYQANAQTIKAEDQMAQTLVNLG